MVPAEAKARRRSLLRPFQRRPLPPRHLDPALAARQGATQCTFDQLKQKAVDPMKLLA
jgi:hypothetical protein